LLRRTFRAGFGWLKSFRALFESCTFLKAHPLAAKGLASKEQAMAAEVQWHFSGDYFENCNCSVVCPCLVSKNEPLTARPTEGVCDVVLIFHIESGKYDGTALDGLNVALAVHAPGPMAEGNWSVAAYIDQRAGDKQTEALGAIFTGARATDRQEPRGEKGADHLPH
jgi:hypothetical protein